MIGKIYGYVDDIDQDYILVNVSGVCYLVYCFFFDTVCIGDKITLHIDAQFRESGYTLYGFRSSNEKRMFGFLTSVQGVGSKLALSMLGALSLVQITDCVLQKHSSLLQQVSGVGSKLANRIIAELNSNKHFNIFKNFLTNDNIKNGTKEIYDTTNIPSVDLSPSIGRFKDDAISALVNLGVKKYIALQVIEDAAAQYSLSHKTEGAEDFQEFLKLALNILNKQT